MRFIFSCGLLLALAACRSDRVPAQDAEKNSSASVVTPTTTPEDAAAGLKRDPDGELHMADWSVTDSQIGAVMRIGKQRRPSQNDDFAVTTSSRSRHSGTDGAASRIQCVRCWGVPPMNALLVIPRFSNTLHHSLGQTSLSSSTLSAARCGRLPGSSSPVERAA